MKEQMEVRRELEAAYKEIGGRAKFAAWAKTHRSSFYNMFVKLLPPMQVVNANTQVNVNVADGDAARQKLQDAFMRLIEARDLEKGTVIVDDEVVYRDVAHSRITDATQDGGRSSSDEVFLRRNTATIDAPLSTQDDTSPTRLHDEPKRTADPSARDAPPATRDDGPVPRADGREVQNKNHPNLESDRDRTSRGLRPDVTVRARPVTAEPREPSTTQKYLDWANSGGGRRTRWDNNQ